jgi:hypothetical protein
MGKLGRPQPGASVDELEIVLQERNDEQFAESANNRRRTYKKIPPPLRKIHWH